MALWSLYRGTSSESSTAMDRDTRSRSEIQMSTQHEQVRAMRRAYRLLLDLLDPMKTPKVPKAIRDRVRSTVKHYPHPSEIRWLALRVTEVEWRTWDNAELASEATVERSLPPSRHKGKAAREESRCSSE